MSLELLGFSVAAWCLAASLALAGRAGNAVRGYLAIGGVALVALCISTLPSGAPTFHTWLGLGPSRADFQLAPSALWLLGFGLPGAIFAAALGPPTKAQSTWVFGAAASFLGALGVFGFQDAASFLVAWEIMSLGGAVMIFGDNLATESGRPVLFMLALLETGTVALILAFVILGAHAQSFSFSAFAAAAAAMPRPEQLFVGALLLIGFGAKLGLLPFYEWFPGAYGAGSGATGAVLSGVVLNAAFFALSRALLEWLPVDLTVPVSIPGVAVVTIAVLSAIVTALYAFQQEGWRELLSLSSAENGSIAVCLLGAALMFRRDGLMEIASLAWVTAQLHLAGHALAKGTMFLSADASYRASGDYRLVQRGVLAGSPWIFGMGALFGAMSLAAMPPQAGFVSEWYLFQTFFQGFHLASLGSRLTAALAGAGLALTAAVSLATFVKVFGIGLLGRRDAATSAVPLGNALAIGCLGLLVLALAVGMPVWLDALRSAVAMQFGTMAVQNMHVGALLVPATGAPIRLSGTFAFISPSLLVVVMPLLALVPLALLLASRQYTTRQVTVWYGGRDYASARSTTTALTFSNALRTFYSFVYRPTAQTERELPKEACGQPYFIKRLTFSHDVAPIFGPRLFAPSERLVHYLAAKLGYIQSGHLNLYLSLIGILLIVILVITLV
jgi:formate hydrogenlyase subunit 3/multisubunit Na+/H+ antiporter MnhD subunit